MERIQRVVYYVGLGMALTLFGLLLSSVVPHMAYDFMPNNVSEEEALAMVHSHPAYVAMLEKYPDAITEFEHGTHSSIMRVGVWNYTNGQQLILHLDVWIDRVHVSAWCAGTSGPTERQGLDPLFVKSYIETTDCLDRPSAPDTPIESHVDRGLD